MSDVHFGVVGRDILLADDRLSFLRGMIERRHPAPPFAQSMDVTLTVAEDTFVVFEGTPSERFFNPLGTVHGG
ncbi:MAG: hypothetical protein NTZ14_17635 [Hyphomicrobiales bacterium]|nr:hypothetical protein [Hyphomicrobiales bacterium]